jgi:hypothetical protein
MDTLWASLIALFLIALAIVVAFNLLQGRQSRLRDAWRQTLAGNGRSASRGTPPAPARTEPVGSAAASGPRAARVDTETQRIEPTLGPQPAERMPDGPPAAGGPAPAPVDTDDEPGFDADDLAQEPTSLSPDNPFESDTAAGPILDPRLDCIVPFGLGAPVAAERLMSAASTLRRAGSKPIAVEVDAGDGHWSMPHASLGALRRVRAGVLLANRHGPLNAMEFSEFSNAMTALGRAIGAGGAIVPEMTPVLEHARQLDDACAQFDAVIGLNVETPTALSPGELAALAAGLGLQERGNTRFAALGDDGEVLFSLALGDRAELLTLLLDVPRAPQEADPWARMVDAARECAARTGGRVVDDANRLLTDAAAAEVERQLTMRYRSLHEAGLDAGSPAALRVFN